MSEIKTYTPIRGMLICENGTGDYVLKTEAEERHAKELQELKDRAVEWFRDFVTNYAFEAGHTEIEKGAEHYIKIFTQKLNEK